MPSGLAPLCPSCFGRARAWTASSCPECKAASSVSSCDVCTRSRAGAFAPEDEKGGDGGAQRFVCVECIEEILDTDVSDRMFHTFLGVAALTLLTLRFEVHPAFNVALIPVSVLCFAWWIRARLRQKRPARHLGSTWSLLRRRIAKAVSRRPGALRR